MAGMDPSGSLDFHFGVCSDTGVVRPRNEDAAFASSHLLALADGMGGAPAGDVAAAVTVQAFADPGRFSPEVGVDWLRAAAIAGNDAISRHVELNPECRGMGTTLTAVRLEGSHLSLLHIGDSRAYLLRSGRLYQLTCDDTFVESLVKRGVIPRDAASSHPQRHLVVKVLMGRADERFIIASFDVQLGDRMLLCTDGVSDTVERRSLTSALLGEARPWPLCGAADRTRVDVRKPRQRHCDRCGPSRNAHR